MSAFRETAHLAESINQLEAALEAFNKSPRSEPDVWRMAGVVSLLIPILNVQIGRLLREIVPPGWRPCHGCTLTLTDNVSRLCPTCTRRRDADLPKAEPLS